MTDVSASVPRQHLPWVLRDLARLVWFEAVSIVVILGCFVACRHTHVWAHQLYWIVGGIVALLLAGAGWAVWVLIGARTVRTREVAVMARVDALIAASSTAPAEVAVLQVEGALLSRRGMEHYHREGCLMAQRKSLSPASLRTHLDAGRTACRMCQP